MTYVVSVDEVEQQAGVDLFYQLPDSIENKIEADYTFTHWTL